MSKPCDVIKSKWPRKEMSPMIVCLCEGRRRKVKVQFGPGMAVAGELLEDTLEDHKDKTNPNPKKKNKKKKKKKTKKRKNKGNKQNDEPAEKRVCPGDGE